MSKQNIDFSSYRYKDLYHGDYLVNLFGQCFGADLEVFGLNPGNGQV